MSAHLSKIIVSSGEPAGVGPDICLALALEPRATRWAVLADPELLAARAARLGLDVELLERASAEEIAAHRPGSLQVLAVPLRGAVTAGRPDVVNVPYVLEQLERAAALCLSGACEALVTAPVQKSIINAAGVPFSGHTEHLAELTGAPLPVMMLASDRLRVALVTTHLPLARVPDAIDAARLAQTIEIVDRDLKRWFGFSVPRIRVLGLNPHAGEAGTLGDEEQRLIEPVLATMRARGIELIGPTPADTAFTPEALASADVVLAMFHDQGLPAIKALAFGEIVNVTLGLPILRTSVDHGTALEFAGTGRARHASLAAALALAERLAAVARA